MAGVIRHMSGTNKRPVLPESMAKWRHRRCLVGVSGGADSVALLRLLLEEGFTRLVVCHLNHRLRGRESAWDARHVRSLAERHGLPCETGAVDVRAEMRKSGESMETAARNARHGFFAACASKYRCRRVFLAHHADDQAETVLWNLLRGSHDLKGMKEEQRIRCGGMELLLLRPLLGIRRADLVAWLGKGNWKWREDSSNREPVAVRNRLRHEVMPLLAEISGRDPVPALVRGAADAAERALLEDSLLKTADLLDPQGRLHLPSLRELPVMLQRAAIRKLLVDRGVPGVDRKLLESALCLLDPANSAVLNLPGGGRLRRKEGRLWVELQP